MQDADIKIFKSEDGRTEIEVRIKKESVWLNQYQIAELFQTDRTSILRHINNIFKFNELDKESTCAKIAQVQNEGGRQVERTISVYNLDVILSVGYRVNSDRGRQFRIWANSILSEYLIRGYALNEKKLKEQNEKLKELKDTVKPMKPTAC